MNIISLFREIMYSGLKSKGDEYMNAAIYHYVYGVRGTISWESGKIAAATAQVFYALSKAFEATE